MKILVYDDNPDYGGHQIMACHGIEALTADPKFNVVFMFNPQNRHLADRTAELPNLQRLNAPCTTQKLQGLRNRITQTRIHTLAKRFKELAPDLILCIQGEVEDSSQAILAAQEAGIRSTSYIAIPHAQELMGAKFGRLRDRINQYLFNQPDRYIAISQSMKKLLIERGVTQPIEVVPNGIPSPPPAPATPAHGSRLTLGLIGRIEFNQKQQDFMVRTFGAFPDSFAACQLILAGRGPDEKKLERLIADSSRRDDITLLPWQDDAEAFYASIDFLMLPSRFEGVPLVMLEALARGIPVLGSECDGMHDILPAAWTFEPENAAALAETFTKTQHTWMNEIAELQARVKTQMTIETFKVNFRHAICKPIS